MIANMKNADGYPIYVKDNPDGSHIAKGTLDICNGQPDKTFGYRYHTSQTTPYIVQCLMVRVPDQQDLPRVMPLEAANDTSDISRGRPAGTPPLYQREAYHLRYAPSDTPGCYDSETRTGTGGGEVKMPIRPDEMLPLRKTNRTAGLTQRACRDFLC